MIDMGEFDARRAVPQSGAQQDCVFARFRDRLKGLTVSPFGSTIETVVNNKERNLKALTAYVAQRNSIRGLFGQRPLSLTSAQDRQQLANDISSSLSPEHLTCDGELPRSQIQRKWIQLTRVRQQLERMDSTVAFYE